MSEISIIIPVYNSEKYLEKCLESMINQTFKDIEVICINDGSTDNSLKILEEYKNKDSRIKVINNKNQGPGLSRQCGVNNVDLDSKYLMFCDSDDWYEPDMCEKMYNAIEQQNVDIVMCDTTVHIIENDNNQSRLNGCINNRKIKLIGYQSIDETNICKISTLLFNKILKFDIIKKYNIEFPDAKMHDDSTFIFQYLLLTKTYYGLDEKLYNYAYRKNSLVYNAFNNIAKELYYPSINCISLLDKVFNKNCDLILNKKFIADKMFNFFFYDYSHLIKIKHKMKLLKMLHNILKNVDYIPANNTIFLLIKKGKIFEAATQLEKRECFSPLHKIFSIKNSYDRRHKIITVLGLRIKIKRGDNMLKKILQNVFSVKRKEHHKIITILGVKIKLFQPKTNDLHYCPICNQYGQFLPFGVIPRPAANCPHCGSLERHRFLYFIYKKYFLNTKKQIKLLHTAPEKCIYDLIKKNPKIDYTPIDLFPEGYKFCQCLKEDVTNLSFKDNTFDFVISNQVMEHILDENKFLSELLRVLKPGGYLLLNFPVFMDLEKTFQDDSITSPEDREKYYGQSDHVRKYGRDIFDKLKKKYNAKVIFVSSLMNPKQIKKYSLLKNGFIAIIQK